MPSNPTIRLFTRSGDWLNVPVPSAEEVLEFANKVRTAGGANILDALLPSTPRDPKSCLIANALNFSCQVKELYDELGLSIYNEADGTRSWGMYFPENVDEERVRLISQQLSLKYSKAFNPQEYNSVWTIIIPASMRNAAIAFDRLEAFTEFTYLRDGD